MPDVRDRNAIKQLEIELERGQILFSEDERSRELYILLEGEVEIRKREVPVAVVREAGSYLGEMSSLLGLPRSATAVALRSCRLLRVPAEKVDEFFHHSPDLALKLARLLARRLHETTEKVGHLMQESVPGLPDARVKLKKLNIDAAHQAFLRLYRAHIGETIPMRQAADILNLSHVDFERVLVTFEHCHLISIREKSILFLDAQDKALRQLILTVEG